MYKALLILISHQVEMNAAFGLKHPDWDLSKSKYAEIDEFPLMTSLGPVLTILAVYLVFVVKVGPSFMRKREAYKLSNTMLIYNAIQVIISAYLVCRFCSDLMMMGLTPKTCFIQDDLSRPRILNGTYIYFAAKLTELLDTVFFVIRKKDRQITFLHLYHHTIMVLATWALLKYAPTHALIFTGFLNSLVHVFMYTYYGLATLGPNVAKYLTWKKYMTKFQLVQFVSIIIQYLVTITVSECPPNRGISVFYAGNTFFFLILFLNFYRQSYIKRKEHKSIELQRNCLRESGISDSKSDSKSIVKNNKFE